MASVVTATADQIARVDLGPCNQGGLHEVAIAMKDGHKYTIVARHNVLATLLEALDAEQIGSAAPTMNKFHFGKTIENLSANDALQRLIAESDANRRCLVGGKDIASTPAFDVRRTQDQKALSIMILVAATVVAIASAILFAFGTVVTAPATIAVASWALTGPAIGSAVLSLLGYVGGAYLLGNAQAREEARHASTGANVPPPAQVAQRRASYTPAPPTHVAV